MMSNFSTRTIGCITSILGILGILTIPTVGYGYYTDTEQSHANQWTAGVVDTGLQLSGWDDAGMASSLSDEATVSHTLVINTENIIGDEQYEYRLQVAGADEPLCQNLLVSSYRNNTFVHTSLLSAIDQGFVIGESSDEWRFEFSPVNSAVVDAGTCMFEYVVATFSSEYGYGVGFYDQDGIVAQLGTDGFGQEEVEEEESEEGEEETSEGSESEGEEGSGEEGSEGGQASGNEEEQEEEEEEQEEESEPSNNVRGLASIRLNEIAGDAIDDFNPVLRGKEWIEVVNIGTTTIDIGNWQVSEIRGSTEKFYLIKSWSEDRDEVYTMGEDTLVDPGEFVVIIWVGENRLNNDGDTLALYLPDGVTLVDQYTYDSAETANSEGRLPDGTGPWAITARTPQMPNELPVEEEEAGDEPTEQEGSDEGEG